MHPNFLAAHPAFSAPFKLTVCVTNICDLECAHCYSDCTKRPASTELKTDEWLGFVDELIEKKVMSVFFEGGEPLLRPDFMRILERCSPKMMIFVRTFAHHITTDVAAEFRRLRVGVACVDILGGKAETHDRLVGTPGNYDQCIQGIRNLVDANVDVYKLMILNRLNAPELQEYVDRAADLGVEKVGVLRLYPLGRAKRRWSELSLSLEEMMHTLQSVRVPAGLELMHSWHPNDGNSCYQMATVDADGNSIGCPYLREYVNFGNIRETPFWETWNDPLYQELRSGAVDDSCTDCADSQGSKGGCRATAYAFTGKWDAPDPFCVNSNRGVDLRVLPDRLFLPKP